MPLSTPPPTYCTCATPQRSPPISRGFLFYNLTPPASNHKFSQRCACPFRNNRHPIAPNKPGATRPYSTLVSAAFGHAQWFEFGSLVRTPPPLTKRVQKTTSIEIDGDNARAHGASTVNREFWKTFLMGCLDVHRGRRVRWWSTEEIAPVAGQSDGDGSPGLFLRLPPVLQRLTEEDLHALFHRLELGGYKENALSPVRGWSYSDTMSKLKLPYRSTWYFPDSNSC